MVLNTSYKCLTFPKREGTLYVDLKHKYTSVFQMYKMRPGRTRPQGLLMLVFLLMLIVLAVNVLVYQLTPQYSTYGSQHYIVSSLKTAKNTFSQIYYQDIYMYFQNVIFMT